MSEQSLNDALRRGVAAHKSGNLVEAAKLYETVLHVLPDHVDANHNLGLIALSTGKSQLAITYIKKALAKEPSNFQFRSSYVGALIENGQYTDAQTYMSEIKKMDPTDHRFDGLLQKIQKTQANITKKGVLEELVKLYQSGKYTLVAGKADTLLSMYPNSVTLLNILGASFSALKLFDRAIEIYSRALDVRPNDPDVNNNLGNALRRSGNIEGAVNRYDTAINSRQNFFDAFLNKGHALLDLNKPDAAIMCYRRAIEINPRSEEAYLRLGNAFKKKGRIKDAISSYKEVLSINPAHGVADHLYNSLNGGHTKTAPRKYVESLFDHYAKTFEQSLVDKLDYDIPKKLTKLMESEGLTDEHLSILDMGCGTGLFGEEIRPYCKLLDGVDLSAEMLSYARTKRIYNHLEHADILEFLKYAKPEYNCFVATDVFIYLGDLEKVFESIKKRSSGNGFLAFSTEHTDAGDYKLEQSARYSHSTEYIQSLCIRYKYQIMKFELTTLRKETSNYITGGLYILSF